MKKDNNKWEKIIEWFLASKMRSVVGLIIIICIFIDNIIELIGLILKK